MRRASSPRGAFGRCAGVRSVTRVADFGEDRGRWRRERWHRSEAIRDDHRDHAPSEAPGAHEAACDLRLADATAIVHRDLDAAHAGPNRDQHQLWREVASGRGEMRCDLSHRVAVKHLERASDIRETRAVVQILEQLGDRDVPVAQEPPHVGARPDRALARAGSEHGVELARIRQELRDVPRYEGAVRLHEDDEIPGGIRQRTAARGPIALDRLRDDPRACGPRQCIGLSDELLSTTSTSSTLGHREKVANGTRDERRFRYTPASRRKRSTWYMGSFLKGRPRPSRRKQRSPGRRQVSEDFDWRR